MRNLARIGALVALLGGVFWLVKVTLVFLKAPTLLIGVFYFAGLLGPAGAGAGLSGTLLREKAVAAQIVTGVVLALVFVALTFVLQDFLEIPFRSAFSEFVLAEIPILIEGIVWGVVGLLMWRTQAGRTNPAERGDVGAELTGACNIRAAPSAWTGLIRGRAITCD